MTVETEAVGHLVLIGLTGSGKTTVGRLVAARLGRDFIDTDRLVEETAGSTIRSIFDTHGEDEFRRREQAALLEILGRTDPAVVATGGGVVERAENRLLLRRSDIRVVWLLATPEVVLSRLRQRGHRPLLDDDPEGTLQEMWRKREPLYREVADVIVSVDQRSLADVVEAVLR